MKVTDISIKRPMLVTVVIIVVLLLGGVSLSRLSIDLMPNMQLPVIVISTTYPGTSPEEVEEQVTKPLESVLSSVSDLDTISSTSSTGSSIVMLQFAWGTDINFASLDARGKIDIIRSYLPDKVSAPTIYKADLSMMPIMQIAAQGKDSMALTQLLDDAIVPRLERVSGVASVYYVGGWKREIQVQVDPVKLNGYGLSLNSLTSALSTENSNFSAGTVREGRNDLLLRVTGELTNLDQVRRIVVGNFGGSPVYLSDVAQVVDGQKKVTQINRVNGEPGISLMISKQSGANTVATSQAVRAELAQLQRENPGVKFAVTTDQALYIEQSINNLVRTAVEGAVLAVLIILLFLRSFRSTVIISTSIPIAIIGAFVLLYFDGMTINVITLGGLALGVGLIVDDSIVVLENIYRHCGQGLDRVSAARQATDEVGGAVIASSLTVVAVFLPIIFVQGLAAQLFTPMALSISFCILASLAVAITLVPLLASRWLKVAPSGTGADVSQTGTNQADTNQADLSQGKSKSRGWQRLYDASERGFNKINDYYRILLQGALKRRWLTILVVWVIFLLTLGAIPLVGMEFMPASDQGAVAVSVEMPKGTALAETDRVVREIEAVAQTMPGIDSITSSVGSSGSMLGGGDTNQAQVTLTMLPLAQRKNFSAADLVTRLSGQLKQVPGADIKVSAAQRQMGGSSAPVDIQISGNDLTILTDLGNQVAEAVRQVSGAREVTSSLQEGRPELHVLIDRDRAAGYGLNLTQIATTVSTAVNGTVATTYRVGGKDVDMRVQLIGGKASDFTVNALSGLTITSPSGLLVPLNQVAKLQQGEGPNSISRKNQARQVNITAQLLPGHPLSVVTKNIQQKITQLHLPPGYNVSYGGDQQQMMESFGALGLALILAIILVYLVMVAQFESLLYPFVIMLSVPVTLTGVVIALLISGRSFSITAFIGVIMLVGIVVKNAIVLVDYVNILRRRGMERNQAILTAGPVRLRPILMTAFATVMAMLPMALGIGEGAESQA
ncbi:MAG: efflux RND transporter permease subunit, partial [Firmicutes bacterium]|nr:efflux RND transporter permease subunit [Bacillota bacterium]